METDDKATPEQLQKRIDERRKAELEELSARLEARDAALKKSLFRQACSSEPIRARYTVSPEMLYDLFGDRFEVVEEEAGSLRLVGIEADGSRLCAVDAGSWGAPNDVAESLEILISRRCDASSFLRREPRSDYAEQSENASSAPSARSRREVLESMLRESRDVGARLAAKRELFDLVRAERDAEARTNPPPVNELLEAKRQLASCRDVGERIRLKGKIHDLQRQIAARR